MEIKLGLGNDVNFLEVTAHNKVHNHECDMVSHNYSKFSFVCLMNDHNL